MQVLLNCAGIREFAGIDDVTPEQMLNSYRINAMGPLFAVQKLLKYRLLQKGALVANVTSLVQSKSATLHELCGIRVRAGRCP